MTTASRPTPPVAPGRMPVIGHAYPMWRRPLEFLDTLTAYDRLVAVHLGPKPTYVLAAPDLVNRVMVADAANYAKGRSFEKLQDYLGQGLATSEGSFHLRQRRLMQPAFHHRQIALYADTMTRIAAERAASWRVGQLIDVTREMHDLSLALVTATLFSTALDDGLTADIHQAMPIVLRGMYTRVLDPTGLWHRLPTPGNRRLATAQRRLRGAIDHLIRTRRDNPQSDHRDLLSMLLDAQDSDSGEAMTDQQVHDELITLLVAGTETAAGGLAWLFHELGENPSVDRQLHAELRSAAAEPPAPQDPGRLPYLRRVLDEALRMRNPGGMTIRRATTDVELGGYHFAPGTEFIFSALVLHRNPHYFPDPTRFDPDRWLPDRTPVPRGAYIPFGAGNHLCIGESYARMEMTAVVAAIASRWRLEPVPGVQVRGVMTSTNNPANLLMRVRARENTPAA
ncbi:cytochrome P450 [Kitasatospora sp. GP30]|uniref:cytochrome P450 n=1 Tax=Kitasatospora sp. GP30 TaxID=3035084 RepID=UPI000C703043|nr:cytochrome P450 [Kitasatospora sp. GP30]MDH6144331.1 cytochrome P450 [Kitasatospora sp. GP30]